MFRQFEGNSRKTDGTERKTGSRSKLTALSELNDSIRECMRCSLAGSSTHHVVGEGNPDARLFIVPQAPGEQEDAENRMFAGPSGKIFRELIDDTGLAWDAFYASNLIKCMLPHCRHPKVKEIAACSSFLQKELAIVRPEIIVPLGLYAARFIFGFYKRVEVKREEFPDIIGKLFRTNDEILIYPLSHPASVIYKPELREGLNRTYRKLGVLRQPCKWFPVCPMTRFTREGKLDQRWSELYCRGDWSACVRYDKEERGEYHPDSMLPDGSIDASLESSSSY